MSRLGRYLISSDDTTTPAVASSVAILSTAQGGTGLDTSADTGTPWLVAGSWDINGHWMNVNHSAFTDVPDALTKAAAGGYDLYFPKATYTIDEGGEWTWPDGVNAYFDDATISYTLALATDGNAITLGSNICWWGRVNVVATNGGATQQGTAVYAQNESNITIDHLHVEDLPMGLELTNCDNVYVKLLTGDDIKGQYSGGDPKGSIVAMLACDHVDITAIQATDVWKAGVYFSPTTRLDSLSASLASTANTNIHIGSVDLVMDSTSTVANGIGMSSGTGINVDNVRIKYGLYGVYFDPNDNDAFATHPTISQIQFGSIHCVDQSPPATADGKGLYIHDGTQYGVSDVQIGRVYVSGSSEEGIYIQRASSGIGLSNIKIDEAIVKTSAQEGIFIDGMAGYPVQQVTIGRARVESNADESAVHIDYGEDITIFETTLYDVAEFGVLLSGDCKRVLLPTMRATDIARHTAASDDVVYVAETCTDCEVGSVWAWTTTGNQHDKAVRVVKLTDGACRVTGNIYSYGGSSADTVALGDNGLVSIRNGEIYDGAAPTDGTWQEGRKVWNLSPASGGSPGWVCTISGTFSAATDAAGDTDGASGVITGVGDTSDFFVGQYVTVSAGFASTGPFLITALTASTITVDALSNAAQNNVTIATPDPEFKAMANLA